MLGTSKNFGLSAFDKITNCLHPGAHESGDIAQNMAVQCSKIQAKYRFLRGLSPVSFIAKPAVNPGSPLHTRSSAHPNVFGISSMILGGVKKPDDRKKGSDNES